jgi:hypothetical protein
MTRLLFNILSNWRRKSLDHWTLCVNDITILATGFVPQKMNVYPQINIRHEDKPLYYDTEFITDNATGCT